MPSFPPAFWHPVTHSCFVQVLRKSFVAKAVLMPSASSPSHYVVVIICGSQYKLAFCHSNSATSIWAQLSGANRSYCDIVFHNNYLCALADDGSVEGWNICQQIPRKILDVKPTAEIHDQQDSQFSRDKFSTQLYLVISEGEVLLVRRYIGNFVNADGVVVDEGYLLSLNDTHPLICPYRTKHFSVYKLWKE